MLRRVDAPSASKDVARRDELPLESGPFVAFPSWVALLRVRRLDLVFFLVRDGLTAGHRRP